MLTRRFPHLAPVVLSTSGVRLSLLVLASLAVPVDASADPADAFDAAAAPRAAPTLRFGMAPPDPVEPRLAFGVNAPWRWLGGSFGVSVQVGVDPHHAIRANLAWYDYTGPLTAHIGVLAGGDTEDHFTGRVGDSGIGWVWYPKRLWDGFTIEAGVLRRERSTREEREFEPIMASRSTTYAARVMIGLSWLITRHAYLAAAVGLSTGIESGTDTSQMATTTRIERPQVDAESYLRFGLAFGK